MDPIGVDASHTETETVRTDEQKGMETIDFNP